MSSSALFEPPTVMSRSNIIPASLPSISPEWIPAWASSVGRPLARKSAGLLAPSFDAMTSHKVRPSLLLPIARIVTCGLALASFCSQSSVSA